MQTPQHVTENFRKFSQVETFREVSGIFTNDVHALFLTCLPFTFGKFLLCFYIIIYVSGNFPEIFITTLKRSLPNDYVNKKLLSADIGVDRLRSRVSA
jgi:hypothetical protein